MKIASYIFVLPIALFSVTLGIFLYYCYEVALSATYIVPATVSPFPAGERDVALTFDDGPYGQPTEKLLTILKNRHVPATFFIVGKNVEKYPLEVRQEIADGNLIANHTYNHTHVALLGAASFKQNIAHADAVIFKATGLHPRIFRAPYGQISPTMLAVLSQEGYALADWTVDTNDWNNDHTTSQGVIRVVTLGVRSDGIVLLHDGRDTQLGYPRDNMLQALPSIITHLKNKGYTFVTVDKILHQQPYFPVN
jgi:peptidoglycan/xylan/chitin deacetylase (PgdA/CDA1 family)